MPSSRDARGDRIEDLEDAESLELDRLEREFYAEPEDLEALLLDFVSARPAVFGPVPR
jgi:hypothetical protein